MELASAIVTLGTIRLLLWGLSDYPETSGKPLPDYPLDIPRTPYWVSEGNH